MITLNNGIKMPVLGLGTMQVKNLDEIIPAAIDAGYRLIDTAANYDNEEIVGAAIKKSNIAREELFITSKLQILRDGYEGTIKAFENSLKNLQMDYLDLYLIHQPYGDIYGEWRALEKLYRDGKIRAIGVSNFEPFQIVDLIMHNDIKPAVNQVKVHPYYQEEIQHDFHVKNDIVTEAWAPFAENKNNLFKERMLVNIAEKYNKSVQQIILRWLTQRGIVAIPRTTSIEHAKANLEIFDFELTSKDMDDIKTLDTKKTVFLNHLYPDVTKLLSTVVANPNESGSRRPSHDEWMQQNKIFF